MSAPRPIKPYELQSPYLEDSSPPLLAKSRNGRPSRLARLYEHMSGILAVLDAAAPITPIGLNTTPPSDECFLGKAFCTQIDSARETFADSFPIEIGSQFANHLRSGASH